MRNIDPSELAAWMQPVTGLPPPPISPSPTKPMPGHRLKRYTFGQIYKNRLPGNSPMMTLRQIRYFIALLHQRTERNQEW
jgi:hypothetical protein